MNGIYSFVGKALSLSLSSCLLLGCGSTWRLHDEVTLQVGAPADESAPNWVKGKVPFNDPGKIYFVGRSAIPDAPRSAGSLSSLAGALLNDSSNRVGYTMLDERQALQSARNDVYDQMRQLLAPRSAGTLGQLMVVNVDAGTCKTCGVIDGPIRTSSSACNATCNEHGFDAQTGREMGCSKPCGDAADCQQCGNLLFAMDGRWRHDDTGDIDDRLDTDVLQMNIAFDTVLAGMAAYLQQEDAYFEKVHVHDADDFLGRPLAQGHDEWSSWKAWVLMSIPREEWDNMVEVMRDTQDQMFAAAMQSAAENRDRRMAFELKQIQLQQQREQDRIEFDREQQKQLLQYEIEVDRERTNLPGRRFRVSGS